MIIPPLLKKNDRVSVVATADHINENKLAPGLALLRSWGLRVKIGKTIGLKNNQFAGTDKDRLQDLQEQLDNPEVKAIFLARGGYGTVRIVDQLDFSRFKTAPKWIIGYSDITALHAHLQSMGYASLHAEMPAFYTDKSKESVESIRQTLFTKPPQYEWNPHSLNRMGKATGKLVGGNMSILYSLCGSPTAINPKGKILFMEDIGEYLYHIDRMLQNFKRNGWFETLSGLLIGGMTKMKDNEIPFGQNAEEIVASAIRQYNFPVAYHFPAGHTDDNRALLLGQTYTLELTSEIGKLIPVQNV